MFHKEGYKIIVIALVIFTGLILLANKFLEKNWLFYLVALVLGVLLYLILQFFRNPDRTAPLDSNVITSPVDGKVVVIEEVYEAEYFKDNVFKSLFLSRRLMCT